MGKNKKADGGGLRFDTGKIDLGQCPTSLIASVAYNLMKNSDKHGGKYPDNNWRRGMDWTKVLNCLQRHLEDFKNGIDVDPTDGVPTMWKVATNAAFLIEYSFTCPELDDRFTGKVASLHDFPKFEKVQKEEIEVDVPSKCPDCTEDVCKEYPDCPNCQDNYSNWDVCVDDLNKLDSGKWGAGC